MSRTKSWWQSRTLFVGVMEVVAGVASLLIELPPEASITAIIAGVLTIILRVITKVPVGR